MKRVIFIFTLLWGCFLGAQTYYQSTAGVQNTYNGGCPVATCSGTFYDDGGSAGNYSNNINAIYRVFCPNTAGKCLKISFTSFNVEGAGFFGPYDYLSIGNGPAQNSTLFTTSPADASGYIYGTPAVPFSYTANNSSGCLTVRFSSDGSTKKAGWAATLSCVNCAAAQPAGNSDCSSPTQICSNANLTDNSPGPGINATDGCSGCVTGETYSNWYVFSPQTSGSLSMAINPNVGTDDLDFALYGPGVSCGSLGTPIRCSYAAGSGSSGMGNGAVDNSEDVTGDSWVAPVNVVAGQVYYLMINNWTAGGAGYDLNFAGSTATLDCTPLPIELTSFKGVAQEKFNTLSWTTASESNIDYYTLERSTDGENWRLVSTQTGSTAGDFSLTYSVNDADYIPNEVNYYRLSKTTKDGKSEAIRTISLVNNGEPLKVLKVVNMLGQEVQSDYEGLRIIIYSDGSVLKKSGK
jgi:hypothetical protein